MIGSRNMLCHKCKSKMLKTRDTYHYTFSGLNNVYLENVLIYQCECGEKSPSIPMIPEIHKEIGFAIIKKHGPLNGDEIKFLRKNLQLKATEFVKYIGIDKATYSRWENKTQMPSRSNDRFIRILNASLKGSAKNEIKNLLDVGGQDFKSGDAFELITIPSSIINRIEQKAKNRLIKKRMPQKRHFVLFSDLSKDILPDNVTPVNFSNATETSNKKEQKIKDGLSYDDNELKRMFE